MDRKMARTLNWLRCRAKWREDDALWGEKLYRKGLLSIGSYMAREKAAQEAWDEYHAVLEAVTDEQ